ncbi:ABC transporter permease [bacterium]|nr:ABC transporter permease [bacterium]
MTSESPIQRARRRFRRNSLAMTAFSVMCLLIVIGAVFFAFQLLGVDWPYDPNDPQLAAKLRGPSLLHPLGTDNLGRDVFTRLLHGAYISLAVGFLAVGVSITIGVVVGAVAGYFGKWVDNVLMRIVDAIMCFPSFFLILTVIALLGPSIWNVIVVIGLVSWTGTARLVRAEFLSLREMEYVRAARALGQSHGMIMFRHLLPNALAPVYVTAVLGVAGAIMTEAGLSFLGFGVQPPQASWGNIIADGKTYILDAWWLILFPGVAIFVTTLAFYLTGEGLRQAVEQKEETK